MTVNGEEPALRPISDQPVTVRPHRRPADAVRQVCPYLVAADGGWRSLQPTRDHRCGATLPMAALAVSKQRDLCLGVAHGSCSTYRAARELELAGPGAGRLVAEGGFWPETRSTVLALEPARGRIGLLPGAPGRASGQAMLVGLMVLAFLVLVIARTTPPSSGGATPSLAGGLAASAAPDAASAAPSTPSDPGATAVATASAAPTEEPASPSSDTTPSPVPSRSGSPAASAEPTATPIPADATRYKVKSGDTLSSIAARFNTTVKALKAANGIKGTNIIHVGQVLIIP